MTISARHAGAIEHSDHSLRETLLVLGPDLGAVSGISTHIAQLLDSSLASRYRMVLFQTGSQGRDDESRRDKAARALRSPLGLARAISRERPSIVYLNSASVPKAFWRDAVYLIVARGMGQRIVLELHGGPPPAVLAGTSRLKHQAVKRLLRMAHRVVVLSSIDDHAYRSFDPDLQVTVIPNSIAVPPQAPQAKPLTDDAPLRLLSLGRIVVEKGIYETIEAVDLLRQRGIPVHCTIAGTGPESSALQAEIAARSLSDRVQMIGSVSGDAKTKLLKESDVLVFPTYEEGVPYALLEAMAAGTVPVTCPVGGIVDVMPDSGEPCGLLVPPRDAKAVADAIMTLHNERELARRMSAAGYRRIATSYEVAGMAKQYMELLNGM